MSLRPVIMARDLEGVVRWVAGQLKDTEMVENHGSEWLHLADVVRRRYGSCASSHGGGDAEMDPPMVDTSLDEGCSVRRNKVFKKNLKPQALNPKPQNQTDSIPQAWTQSLEPHHRALRRTRRPSWAWSLGELLPTMRDIGSRFYGLEFRVQG